jgi:hypothetical protein
MTTPSNPATEIERLQRWGIRPMTEWRQSESIYALMPDGYWTPWHLAQAALATETQARHEAERNLAALRATTVSHATNVDDSGKDTTK